MSKRINQLRIIWQWDYRCVATSSSTHFNHDKSLSSLAKLHRIQRFWSYYQNLCASVPETEESNTSLHNRRDEFVHVSTWCLMIKSLLEADSIRIALYIFAWNSYHSDSINTSCGTIRFLAYRSKTFERCFISSLLTLRHDKSSVLPFPQGSIEARNTKSTSFSSLAKSSTHIIAWPWLLCNKHQKSYQANSDIRLFSTIGNLILQSENYWR